MSETPLLDISPTLRILGTAHVSTASVDAVREQIKIYQPDIVAVELCGSRHQALQRPTITCVKRIIVPRECERELLCAGSG